MAELEEIRRRLGTVEQRVDALEEGQVASRRAAELFPGVDRDVADLREAFSAQRHVLQALRDTQLEQGRTLAEHGRAMGAIVVTLQSMQQSQRSMQQSQASMQQTQASMQSDIRALQGDMQSVKATLADHGRVLARLDPGEDRD